VFTLDLPPLIALIALADKIQVVKRKEPAANRRSSTGPGNVTARFLNKRLSFYHCDSGNNIHFLKKSERRQTCKAGVWDTPLLFKFLLNTVLVPVVPALGGVSVADEGGEICVSWKPTSLPAVTGEFSHVCETLCRH